MSRSSGDDDRSTSTGRSSKSSSYNPSRAPYSTYRDDVSTSSNVPIWTTPSHSVVAAEAFEDDDNFSSEDNFSYQDNFSYDGHSFAPAGIPSSSRGSTIVGTFRPPTEEMVDVNVSAHGKGFVNLENDYLFRDSNVGRPSIFSLGFWVEPTPISLAADDMEYDAVSTSKRRLFTGVCCGLIFGLAALAGVLVAIMGKRDEGGPSTPIIVPVPQFPKNNDGTEKYLDSTLTAADCDFTGILEPDVFLQCRCHGHISIYAHDVLVRYNDLKNKFMNKDVLPGYHTKIDSCHPPNVASVWLATDTYPLEHEMQDRYLLALLYASWKGFGWTYQDNWLLASKGHCDWYGVECDSSNRAIGLLLNDNNLEGEIPSEIVKLIFLRTLAIGDNKIGGRVPREFGEFMSLESVRLSGNQLSFSIPTELGLLENLRSLELDHNNLAGTIPTELMRLPVLDYVGLWENRLTGTIPTQIGNLKNCREFKIHSNSLTGSIPTQIGGMAKLTIWESARNPCEGTLPTQFGSLGKLVTLDVSSMGLTGTIISEFGKLDALETLSLADNYFSGFVPTEFGDMTALQFLFMNHNGLKGPVPSQLSQLRDLTKLYMQENNLTGQVPAALATCEKLEIMDLSGNKLEGELPDEICNLRQLELKSMVSDCRDDALQCSVPSCCSECAP